jgi:hypothetical protein
MIIYGRPAAGLDGIASVNDCAADALLGSAAQRWRVACLPGC